MEHRIHVELTGISSRAKLPPSLPVAHDKSNRSSFSVSQIKKRSFSHHHQSGPIHRFERSEDQATDIIHTNIGQTGDNIRSILNEFNSRNKHTSSLFFGSRQQNQPKTSNVSAKSIQVVRYKINPVTSNAIEVEYSRENFQMTKIDQQQSSILSLHANRLDNVINDSEIQQQKPPMLSRSNFAEKSNKKFRPSKSYWYTRPWKRFSLWTFFIPLIALGIISGTVAAAISLTKSASKTNSDENSTVVSTTYIAVVLSNNTNSNNASTISTTASTTKSSTSTTTITVSNTSTKVSTTTTTTSATTKSTTSTTESTTSTTTTTKSTTSTTSTTVSTTSTESTTSRTSSTTTSTSTSSTTSTTSTSTSSTTSATSTSTSSTTSTTRSTTSTTTTTESTTTTTESTTTESTTSTTTAIALITSEIDTTESTTDVNATTNSTTTISSNTTSATPSLVNPCVSGLYWNVNGISFIGNGSASSALNRLNLPTAIFFTSNDTMYITDSNNYRVLFYFPNATSGVIVAGNGTRGNSSTQLNSGSHYLFVDQNATIYVADTSNNRVMRWARGASTGVLVAGNGTYGNSSNQLYNPYGVWVDSNSNVFVTEYSNQRVTQWAPGASSGVTVAGILGSVGNTPNKLANPQGLYYDETNQNLYIANTGTSDNVMKWKVGNPNGTVVAGLAKSTGSNSSQLNYPTGITFDKWKNLYIADRLNARIQLYCNGSSQGITIAGNITGGTTFSVASDVKLDSQLNLYVADTNTHRILKFFKL